MVRQEGFPTLTGRPSAGRPILPHRRDGHLQPDLHQLRPNPGTSPGRIGLPHSANQDHEVRVDSGSPNPPTGFPAPEHPESSPMPSHHGLRSNDHQRPAPSGPSCLQRNPEQAVQASDPRPARGSQEHSQLMAQSQVLQPQGGDIAGEPEPPAQQHQKHPDHTPGPCLRDVENQQLPQCSAFQHPQVKFDVFSMFELSRPLLPDARLSPGVSASGLSESPVTTLAAAPRTYSLPDGSPILVRVSHGSRLEASPYRIQFRRHRGLTRFDAIELQANCNPPYTVNLTTGWATETGERWFRAKTERAISGRSQFLSAMIFEDAEPGGVTRALPYQLSWRRSSGDILAEGGIGVINARFRGGEDTYLVVRLPAEANGGSRFRIGWTTDLTVIAPDSSVLTSRSSELAIRLDEKLFPASFVASAGVRIGVRHGASTYDFANVPSFRGEWGVNQRYSLASIFEFSRPFAFLPDEQPVITLNVVHILLAPGDDPSSAIPVEVVEELAVPFLGSANEYDASGYVSDPGHADDFKILYRRSHRSR